VTTAVAQRRILNAMVRSASAMTAGALMIAFMAAVASSQAPRGGAPAPEFGTGPWINSPPLTMTGLRGRVVLVEFWTYG
jgi:hypothetical protein